MVWLIPFQVGTVGTITNGPQANQLLEEGLDLAVCGRMFQKNPGLVWKFAEELEVQINVANQIRKLHNEHLVLPLPVYHMPSIMSRQHCCYDIVPGQVFRLEVKALILDLGWAFGGRPGAPKEKTQKGKI